MQRALFLSGWYVRRGINLRERVLGSPQTLGEIDVFGVGFDPSLTPSTLICECKDRKGSTKEADRIVWLLGLSRLLRSDHILFAKTSIAKATVQFSRPVNVSLWDSAAVRAIEQRFGVEPDQSYFGSGNIDLCEDIFAPARRSGKLRSRPLQAAWDYLSGAFWYSGTPARTKRLQGYFEALTAATGLEAGTRSGLVAEGLIALLVAGFTTAGQLARFSPGFGDSQQEAAFSSGAADAEALREIAARADDYYQDALQRTSKELGKAAAVQVPRLANAVAEPPHWMPAYLGFARRLGEHPLIAGDALRYADLVLFEEQLADGRIDDLCQLLFPGDQNGLKDVLDLGALFLARVWGIEDPLLASVLSRPSPKPRRRIKRARVAKSDSTGAKALFE
ncbi:MAG TPA: hypothetical protein VGG40_12575 [Solirubrobacterales bacterium]